jgi:hypothetical protein
MVSHLSLYINTSDNSMHDFKIFFYVKSHVDKLFEAKEGWLVRYRECRCADGR